MRPPTRYVTWYVGEMPTCPSENSQLVRTECLESSRQDTDRGKLQGVCGKDWLENKLKAVPLQAFKQEVRSTWSTLTDDSYSSSFYLLQSMWPCRRRRICVGSQHSSVLFFRSKNSAWQELKARHSWSLKLRLEDLKTVTFYFWTLQEDHIPHKVTFTYLLEPLSRAFYMFGCIDIKWVNFMRARGRYYFNPNLFRWVVLAYSNWISWKE